MERKTLERLESIVGKGNLSVGVRAADKFMRPGEEAPHLVVVRPSEDGEVQKVVELARGARIAIVTVNDRYLLEEDLGKEGILLDFSRMDEIERIDVPNLVAHVQRGVTWVSALINVLFRLWIDL